MNKDALLATLIGFGIGLVITGSFIFGPTLVKSFPTISFALPQFSFSKSAPSQSPAPSQAPSPTSLTVASPLPDSIATSSDMLVSGSAPKDALVVVAGQTDEAVVAANETGQFAGKITLSEGINNLLVTSYENGKAESQTLTVYYTPETL